MRRSLGAWQQDCRSGRSLQDSSARRRRCVGRSTPTGDATPIARFGPTGRPVGERNARRWRRSPTAERLRAKVEAKLAELWSPEEISGWLARTYPNDPEMQVSHETIYQSLFIQGRGALRKELHTCLEKRPGNAKEQEVDEERPRHGEDQEHGDDLRAPGRGHRPRRARALGGGPDLRQAHDVDRHPRRAPDPLPHLVEASPAATRPSR